METTIRFIYNSIADRKWQTILKLLSGTGTEKIF